MRIPIAVVIFGAILVGAVISTVVAFVPTYIAGVEGVRHSVRVLRANTISRANNSIALFFKPTDTLIRGLQKLSDSGYVFDTRNESNVFPWLCDMQANLEPTSFKVSIISAPVDGLYPARYYNCESSPNGLVVYAYDNDLPGNASLVSPYWTRVSRPITLWDRTTNSRDAPVTTHAGLEQRTLQGLMGQINDNRNRTWTKVLAGNYGTEMGAAAHFRDTNGNYGRIHAELLPSNLAVLLANLGLQKSGRAIAVEAETRRVIGVSWAGEPMLVQTPQFNNASLPDHLRFSFKSITNLTDSTTTDAVAELGGEDTFYSLPDGYSTTLYSGKKSMFVDIATYSDLAVNLDIRVLVLMSEHEFLEEMENQQDATIGGIVAAVAIMLIVGVAFGLSLARPLQRLGTRMEAAARLENQADEPESIIAEIAEMQMAFNQMQKRLSLIKAFVPHSMFTQLIDSSESSSSLAGINEESLPSNPLDRSTFLDILDHSQSNGVNYDVSHRTAVVDQFVTQPINTFKVTRCTCVVVDWNEVPTDEPDLLEETVETHMKAVISAANRYGATIEQLSPEQIVLTFNAHHSTVMHENIALKLVMKLYLTFKGTPVVIAVDSSDCLVGTVGYAGRQARVVLGECVDVAKKLPSLQRSYLKSQVLVSERCGRACSKRKFAVVDSLRFNWAQSGRVQKIYVCEALDTTSATDIFSKAYRDGVNDLMRGDLRAATNAWKAMDSSEEQVKRMIQAVGSAAGGKDYHRCELPPWEASGAAPIIPTSPEEIPVTSRLADAAVAALADDTASIGSDGTSPQDSGVSEMAGFLSLANHHAVGVNDQTSFNDISGMAWQRSTEPFAQGQFSRVYQAMGPTGVLCSVKTFQKSAHTFDAASVRAEVTSLARLRHENIVSYVSVAVLNGAIGVITEYVPGGSLNEMQKKFDAIPPPALRRFCVDILKGLVFLHTNGIVHCDIKPHNILLNTDGVIKLADFGSALQPRTTTAPTDDGSVFDLRGTTWYMAPEVAQGEDPSAASDMWSFGITLLELSMGTLPWSKDQRMGNESLFIRELARNPQWMPTIPSTLPDETAKAVRLCLQRDPAARPSSKDLLHGSFTL